MMQDLKDGIRSLANANAVGPDEISVELLKIALNGDPALRRRLVRGGLHGAPWSSVEVSTEAHEDLHGGPWRLHGDLHGGPWRLHGGSWSSVEVFTEAHGAPWRSPWSAR